jgi:hypothetical protein
MAKASSGAEAVHWRGVGPNTTFTDLDRAVDAFIATAWERIDRTVAARDAGSVRQLRVVPARIQRRICEPMIWAGSFAIT